MREFRGPWMQSFVRPAPKRSVTEESLSYRLIRSFESGRWKEVKKPSSYAAVVIDYPSEAFSPMFVFMGGTASVRENAGPRVVMVRRFPDWLWVDSNFVETASFLSSAETRMRFSIGSGDIFPCWKFSRND